MTFIGLELSDATKIAKDNGLKVKIVENNSDKQKKFDAVLVTNAVISDGVVTFTVSNFLENIKE